MTGEAEEEGEEQDTERETDLAAQVLYEADRRLMTVYGDTIHRNDGRHLDGGVEDDEAMQRLYDKVVSHPHPMYSPPKGKVGNLFLTRFTAELRKVRARETNSERAMIFPACILRKEPGIRRAKLIRKRILQRIQLWDEGKYAELVNDITNVAQRGSGGNGRGEDEESIGRKYTSLVTDGRLRQGVRWLTNRDGGAYWTWKMPARRLDDQSSRCSERSIRIL